LANWPIWSIVRFDKISLLNSLRLAANLPLYGERVGQMLRIQRSENKEVVFTLSGQMDAETMGELDTLINAEANRRRLVLDLKGLTLANEDAVIFLERCESNSITLENCPSYIREWINRQRQGS